MLRGGEVVPGGAAPRLAAETRPQEKAPAGAGGDAPRPSRQRQAAAVLN